VALVTILAHNPKVKRIPVEIVAVVDASASMKRDLPIVKETLIKLAKELKPNDKFGLFAFAAEAKKIFSLKAMTELNKVTCFCPF